MLKAVPGRRTRLGHPRIGHLRRAPQPCLAGTIDLRVVEARRGPLDEVVLPSPHVGLRTGSTASLPC